MDSGDSDCDHDGKANICHAGIAWYESFAALMLRYLRRRDAPGYRLRRVRNAGYGPVFASAPSFFTGIISALLTPSAKAVGLATYMDE